MTGSAPDAARSGAPILLDDAADRQQQPPGAWGARNHVDGAH
jgi:hypothetical protein